MADYDALIIGAGTGGETVVQVLVEAGKKVALIERELVGGLCAYWGCMPSKTMLRPGDIVWEAAHGVGTHRVQLYWPPVAQYRNYMVRDWDDSKQVQQLQEQGVDFYRGTARIVGPGTVAVDGQRITGQHLVVATGSDPAIPPIPGLAEMKYWTNREATEAQELPESMVILGGGAVGCELAQAYRHFGVEVAMVEAADHLLGAEPAEAAEYLQTYLGADGIHVRTGCKAVRMESDGRGKTVQLDNGTTLRGDVILVATGRQPRTHDLGLESVGIEPAKHGIPVDDHCKAAENVWAVGDVTGVAGFTHIAYYQGEIAAANILGRTRKADYSAIPRVTFTDPEVASVGVTDPHKAPNPAEIVTARADLGAAARTETYGKGLGGALCLLASRKDKVLVGAWAVGPLAGEWVQWAALAVRARIPVSLLEDTILAFPTFTRLYLQPVKELNAELG
jgi:dihydrolipoamide dehydrogenase